MDSSNLNTNGLEQTLQDGKLSHHVNALVVVHLRDNNLNQVEPTYQLVSERRFSAMATDWNKELEKKMETFMENHEKFLQAMHDFDKENDYGLDSQGRIKISIFYSENTNCWLSEAEMIFSRNRLSEAEKIEAATACFGDNAGEWFQLVDRRQAVRTWEELKGLMIGRFRSSQEANVSASEEFEKHHRQSSEIPTLTIQDSMNQSWEVVDLEKPVEEKRCQVRVSPSPLPSSEARKVGLWYGDGPTTRLLGFP